MILSKENLSNIPENAGVVLPEQRLFVLPEKVLQFGTGVLLRGLPNYFIDKANKAEVFNGRVVVVKSTDKGGIGPFEKQNGMFTLCIRGIENGKPVDKKIINASISRVLSAKEDWDQLLTCARNKDMQVIISNTTETGIRLVREDRLVYSPPSSFPGKLLAFLFERYRAFNGSAESGMVILPTELIPDNGDLLKNICLELAEINDCEAGFIRWLKEHNDFCNTLVDRIVPGALPLKESKAIEKALGYTDELMIMAEPYCLWAIETSNKRTKEILSFAEADSNVIIAKNINKYREIKLRLLNAPHTFSCALAICCGFKTVREAMAYPSFRSYLYKLMHLEIIPVLVSKEISEEEAKIFADKVLDRFSNQSIDHEWLNISLNYSSKMLMRCIPLLLNYYKHTENAPGHMALGFAAYILFMKSQKNENGTYSGKIRGVEYTIIDEKASVLHKHWEKNDLAIVVKSILRDKALWNTDLTKLCGFEKLVLSSLQLLASNGYQKMLQKELISL